MSKVNEKALGKAADCLCARPEWIRQIIEAYEAAKESGQSRDHGIGVVPQPSKLMRSGSSPADRSTEQPVQKPRKCMICGYGRYCNNCQANGDNHKAMFQPPENAADYRKRQLRQILQELLDDTSIEPVEAYAQEIEVLFREPKRESVAVDDAITVLEESANYFKIADCGVREHECWQAAQKLRKIYGR